MTMSSSENVTFIILFIFHLKLAHYRKIVHLIVNYYKSRSDVGDVMKKQQKVGQAEIEVY